jgi:O-antigen ligase
MSQKTCQFTLKAGALLSLLSFFIVTRSLYFPYVTGRQLGFNILMEILLWFWLYLIFKYPAVRPKLSWITWGLAAWLAVLLLSSILGVDFNLSFWGDAERLLGWFSLIHYFILYLIIITVFRTKQDWEWLLNSSIAVAIILAVYSWLTNHGPQFQGNVNLMSNISTLGNATYVAGVMLFNIYFALYFLLLKKDWRLKVLYGLALIIILAEFFYADVSGSQAALAVSLALFGACYGWLHHNKKIKRGSLAGLAGLLIIVVALFVFRNAPLFDNNKLGKILRDFSANNTSLNARSYAWRSGLAGFAERPVLGYGWGNFSAPFDKYFSAGLYDWTPQEEYYDRAHNMIIEMLADAGILGLIAYLGIFATVIVALVKARRQAIIKPLAVAIVVAIFSAYFIHNLAVFDSLANYVCLMIVLAWAFWLTGNNSVDSVAVGQHSTKPVQQKFVSLGLALIALALLFLIFNINVKSAKMLASTLKTAQLWHNGATKEFLSAYQATLAFKTPIDRDSRTLFIGLVTSDPSKLTVATNEEVDQLLNSLLDASRANLRYNEQDYLFLINHAALLELIGITKHSPELFSEALAAIDRAIAGGGEHLPAFFYKSNILLSAEKYDQVAPTLRQALALWPADTRIFCRLAYVELNYGAKAGQAEIWSNFDNCLDKGATDILIPGDYLSAAIKHYEAQSDRARLSKVRALMSAP